MGTNGDHVTTELPEIEQGRFVLVVPVVPNYDSLIHHPEAQEARQNCTVLSTSRPSFNTTPLYRIWNSMEQSPIGIPDKVTVRLTLSNKLSRCLLTTAHQSFK